MSHNEELAAKDAKIAELTACVKAYQRSLCDHAKQVDANLVSPTFYDNAGRPHATMPISEDSGLPLYRAAPALSRDDIEAQLDATLRPVEQGALKASICELDDWLAGSCADAITPSQGEAILLVLHELKRLRAAATPAQPIYQVFEESSQKWDDVTKDQFDGAVKNGWESRTLYTADASAPAQPIAPPTELSASSERGVDYIMAAVQCFASEWSLVGGRFDRGEMFERAEDTKARIRCMLEVDAAKLEAAKSAQPIAPAADLSHPCEGCEGDCEACPLDDPDYREKQAGAPAADASAPTDEQLLEICRQQTNKSAVEKYGDSFLRIAQAVWRHAAPVSGQGATLPPLPPEVLITKRDEFGDLWSHTADQMTAYGQLCIDSRPRSEDSRAKVLEQAAKVAESFGPARPIVSSKPSEIVRGRWEGEQAASVNIAAAIRALASTPQKADNE